MPRCARSVLRSRKPCRENSNDWRCSPRPQHLRMQNRSVYIGKGEQHLKAADYYHPAIVSPGLYASDDTLAPELR